MPALALNTLVCKQYSVAVKVGLSGTNPMIARAAKPDVSRHGYAIKSIILVAPAIKQVRQLYSPLASYMHFVRDIAFGSDMRYARLK